MFFINLENWFCGKRIARIAELEKQLTEIQDKYTELEELTGKDQKYYLDRIAALEKIVATSIELPEVKIEEKQIIDVHNDPRFTNYNSVFADWFYYKLPLKKWEEILNGIRSRLAAKNWRFISEVSDCDDHALLFAGLVAYVASVATLDKSAAFAVAWSMNHAYNLFIDTDNQIWIFEPQTASIVGKLESGSGNYDTKFIWFLG